MSPRNWARRILTAALAGALLLSGCGGSSSEQAVEPGRLAVTIHWPARGEVGRYLPSYAASIVVELIRDDPLAPPTATTQVVNRPAGDAATTQRVEFDQLFDPGNYDATGRATTQANGLGVTVAEGFSEVSLAAGQVGEFGLVLNTAIATLSVQGQPLTIDLGGTLQLSARAADASGDTLLLPSNVLTWSLISGSAGTLSATGLFTAVQPGTATVRVAETGANKSADATVTVRAPQGAGLASTPWPKFQADARSTGRGTGSGTVGAARWTFDAGDPAAGFFSTPVLGPDGTVYASADNGKVYALNGATGAVVWVFDTGTVSRPTAPVLASDGTLYVGSDVNLLAINASNGTLNSSLDLGDLFYQPPAIGADGTVYLVGLSRLHAIGTVGGVLTESWRLDPPVDQAIERNYSTPVAIGEDGTLYLAFRRFFPSGGERGTLLAVSPSGTVLWSRSFDQEGGNMEHGPSIGDDGTVFVSLVDGTVRAINGATGAVQWSSSNIGASAPVAIGRNGQVYVGTFFDNLVALSEQTGAVLWERTLITDGGTPVVGGDETVFVGSASGPAGTSHVYGIDPATGFIVWDAPIIGQIAQEMALGADGTLYLGGGAGRVLAIN